MKIQITQEDIDSKQHSGHSCPVFRAISRKLPGVHYVGPTYIHFIGVIGTIEVDLPKPIVEWIRQYDYEVHTPLPAEFDF